MNDDEFSYYLRELRANSNAAYHALLEVDEADLPKLIDAFYAESVIRVKADQLEIIWQHRVLETLDFLASVLQHPNAKLWKIALDGIVAIGTPLAITILETEKSRLLSSQEKDAPTRLEWVIEALDQLSP